MQTTGFSGELYFGEHECKIVINSNSENERTIILEILGKPMCDFLFGSFNARSLVGGDYRYYANGDVCGSLAEKDGVEFLVNIESIELRSSTSISIVNAIPVEEELH